MIDRKLVILMVLVVLAILVAQLIASKFVCKSTVLNTPTLLS